MQSPFITLNFGLGVSWEARLIQKCILNVRIKGLGKSKRTAIFPKLVYGVKKGVNFAEHDPNYDIKQLALECASKRMYPDILNYDATVAVTGSYKSPMGCRSFLPDYDMGDFDGRANLGVTTINLPRIALESGGDFDKFYSILEDRMRVARIGMDFRIERLSTVTAKVAPILYTEGAFGIRLNPDDPIIDIMRNGRATISMGFIGLHEMCEVMYPNSAHYTSNLAKQKFAENVVAMMAEATIKWKKESGWGYSLYATPAESLCDRFCKQDAAKFGNPEVTSKGYYTNSWHIDVAKKLTPQQKIELEEPFALYATGGHICYVEMPDMKNNLGELEKIWDFSYDHVPYFGVNMPVDSCMLCGFIGETKAVADGFECPSCGNSDSATLASTRRVCGYLGNPGERGFIKGKQNEVTLRVKHS